MPVTLNVDPVKSDCKDDSTVFQLGRCVSLVVGVAWAEFMIVHVHVHCHGPIVCINLCAEILVVTSSVYVL